MSQRKNLVSDPKTSKDLEAGWKKLDEKVASSKKEFEKALEVVSSNENLLEAVDPNAKLLKEEIASYAKLQKLLGFLKQRPLTEEESQEFAEACGFKPKG